MGLKATALTQLQHGWEWDRWGGAETLCSALPTAKSRREQETQAVYEPGGYL